MVPERFELRFGSASESTPVTTGVISPEPEISPTHLAQAQAQVAQINQKSLGEKHEAVMQAIKENNYVLLKAFLQSGVNPNWGDTYHPDEYKYYYHRGDYGGREKIGSEYVSGLPLIKTAAELGHLETVQVLKAAGADINTRFYGRYSGEYEAKEYTPIKLAASKGHDKVFAFLLDAGADVERTAMWMNAAALGHVGILDVLLERGFKVDSRNLAMQTALMLSANKGHKANTERLIQAQANLNVRDEQGKTPLTYTVEPLDPQRDNYYCSSTARETRRLLMEHGADLTLLPDQWQAENSLLVHTAWEGDRSADMTWKILDEGKVSQSDMDAALAEACAMGAPKTMLLLLAYGANLNGKSTVLRESTTYQGNQAGKPPLIRAYERYRELQGMLNRSSGADQEANRKELRKQQAILELLLYLGADIHGIDKQNQTVVQYAKAHQDLDSLNRFLEFDGQASGPVENGEGLKIRLRDLKAFMTDPNIIADVPPGTDLSDVIQAYFTPIEGLKSLPAETVKDFTEKLIEGNWAFRPVSRRPWASKVSNRPRRGPKRPSANPDSR